MAFQQMLQIHQQIQQLQLQMQQLQQQMEQMVFYPQFDIYQQFCITKSLDPKNQNSFYLFYQQNFNETAPQPSNEKNNDTIKMVMTASNGLKIVLFLPKNTTLEEMFRKYMDKISLPFKHVEEGDIVFLYNAEKLDAFSKEPISYIFKNSTTYITVMDLINIIPLPNK